MTHELIYRTSAGVILPLYGGPHHWENIDGMRDLASAPVISEGASSATAGVYRTHNGIMRIIEVLLYTTGGTLAMAEMHYRRLMAVLREDQRAEALGTLLYTNGLGVQRAIDVASVTRESRGYRGRPGGIESTLRFEAPDATFYDPVAKVEVSTFNGVVPRLVTCQNDGDEDAYPVIVWEPVVTDGIVEDDYGRWYQMLETLGVGDVLTMDFNPTRPSFDISGADVYDSANSASRLVRIPPGGHALSFVGADVGDDGAITITSHDRYSSHG